jgi:hypothetical protein
MARGGEIWTSLTMAKMGPTEDETTGEKFQKLEEDSWKKGEIGNVLLTKRRKRL